MSIQDLIWPRLSFHYQPANANDTVAQVRVNPLMDFAMVLSWDGIAIPDAIHPKG